MNFLLLLITLLLLSAGMVVNAQELEYVSSYNTTFSSWIHVENEIACVLDSPNLLILDISVPGSPNLLGSIALPGDPLRFDLQGNVAFVACGDSGIQVVDISSPSAPAIIGRFITAKPAKFVIVKDTLCYLLDDRYFSVLNVATPANPFEIGLLSIGFFRCEGLALKDTLAYVIGDWGEFELLWSIDISDPSDPAMIGLTGDQWSCRELYVFDEKLFVVNEQYGFMREYDISAPDAFIETAFTAVPGITNVIAGSGYLFGSSGPAGLGIYDISSPDTCIEVGIYDTPGSARDLFVLDGYVYIADSSSMLILRFATQLCGDADNDGNVNLIDVLYLIDFLYGTPPGEPPMHWDVGDVNNDGNIDLLDILYLIDFLYGIPPGPEPMCS